MAEKLRTQQNAVVFRADYDSRICGSSGHLTTLMARVVIPKQRDTVIISRKRSLLASACRFTSLLDEPRTMILDVEC